MIKIYNSCSYTEKSDIKTEFYNSTIGLVVKSALPKMWVMGSNPRSWIWDSPPDLIPIFHGSRAGPEFDSWMVQESFNSYFCLQQTTNCMNRITTVQSFGWAIMDKRHSYTDDGNNPTDGLIVIVKKPFLRMARELFALICVRYPNCLGGGM